MVFGAEYVPKKIRNLINNKNVVTNINIYRIQAYNLKMCKSFSIGFIAFMCKGKSLLECRN